MAKHHGGMCFTAQNKEDSAVLRRKDLLGQAEMTDAHFAFVSCDADLEALDDG